MAAPALRLIYHMVVFFAMYGLDEVQGQHHCFEQQKFLLIELNQSLINYRNSGGSYLSTKLVKWDATEDCCGWPGVTCSNGYVTALDLSNEGRRSGLNNSSPLFSLQHLTSLNLADNNHQGIPIPSGFGKLVNLVYLNLSFMDFSGQIPMEMANLTKLVTLDLSTDGFKLHTPNLRLLVRNMSSLRELRLDGVNITASSDWSQVLASSLPRLQVLSLMKCGLTGHIHSSFQNLASLSSIRLRFNNFSAPFPRFFSHLRNLTYLDAYECGFLGTFPSELFQVRTLQYVDISRNSFLPSRLPESIGQLEMLSTLFLFGCNLVGPIPKSISQLTNLVHIGLSDNGLNGSIPSFSKSKNLRELLISHNSLAGSLNATAWEELHQIKRIYMGNNSLSGSIPAFLLQSASLQRLDLSSNYFSGFSSKSIFTPSQLEILRLRDNDLRGPFPSVVFGFQSLEVLDLSFNNINGTLHLSSLEQLKNLSRLDLSHNSLSVEMREGIPSFPRLEYLYLAACKLKEFPESLITNRMIDVDLSANEMQGEILIGFNNLRVVDLSFNQLHGDLPSFPSVEYLDLSRNNFSSFVSFVIDASLSQSLRFLSFSSNRFQGSISESVCNATRLEVLDLSNNLLDGMFPECLLQMSSLLVVNLVGNSVSGMVPDSFPEECNLQVFNVNGNNLHGTVPKSLVRCKNLQILDMGNNKLRDTFPCWMRRLPSLSVLVLRSNLFYGDIQCANGNSNWSRLQIVDIASNNFSGKLPSEQLQTWIAMMVNEASEQKLYDVRDYIQIPTGSFSSYSNYQVTIKLNVKGTELILERILTTFTTADFASNRFEGEIPAEIGLLTALRGLNISHNYLSGSIPPSIGSLQELESLDLGHNKLSGRIPVQLARLNFLAHLNLSFNRLEGAIPRGSQFQTFSNASFLGNKGLCGFPLSAKCRKPEVYSAPQSPEPSSSFVRDVLRVSEVGYAVGLGLVIMPLIFWPRWRMMYFEITDRILLRIFLFRGPRRINR